MACTTEECFAVAAHVSEERLREVRRFEKNEGIMRVRIGKGISLVPAFGRLAAEPAAH